VPDLIFISTDNKVIVTNTEVDGAPDLVVEIVSPDSLERDWRVKYLEYEKAGIKEYWVIDPIYEKMNIYCLNKQGKYEAQKTENNILKSKVLPGFWIKPEWLWQELLPNVISIAKALKIKI
jgi:Uma2 family endonuclease